MIEPAIPTHKPTCAIHIPAGGDLPSLIAVISSQPIIAAGTPVKKPQQKRPTTANAAAVIARVLAPIDD